MTVVHDDKLFAELARARLLLNADLPADATFMAALEAILDARYGPLSQGARMGSVLVTADQTGITALADLTGYSITFNAVAGRIYRVDYSFGTSQVTAAGAQVFRLNDSVGGDLGIIDSKNQIINVVNAGGMVSGFREVTGLSAGAHTLKLRGTTSAGTLTIPNSSAVNGRFAVYDVGT